MALTNTELSPVGLRNDRVVALIDANNWIVTDRELLRLVQLQSKIVGDQLQLKGPNFKRTFLPLPQNGELVKIKLFRNEIVGLKFDRASDKLISNYLSGSYRLGYLGSNYTQILKKRGGRQGELKGFTDSSPIHLKNIATLSYINVRLEEKASIRNFSPNIVVNGAAPFEEDSWKKIKINDNIYRVQEKTQRCVFTTIGRTDTKRNSRMEPLATIAKIRFKESAKPTFGINLVPQAKGRVSLSDTFQIIERF